jgi:hypothetical protein
MEESRSALKILIGKLTRKNPLGRQRHRWNTIIEVILKK